MEINGHMTVTRPYMDLLSSSESNKETHKGFEVGIKKLN